MLFFLFSKSCHPANRRHNVITQNAVISRFNSMSLQLSSTLQINITRTCICISPRPNQLQWVSWHVDGDATCRRAYELQVNMALRSERLLYNLQRERHPAQECYGYGSMAESSLGRWQKVQTFVRGDIVGPKYVCVCIYIYIYIQSSFYLHSYGR
jgi:hypothetical protein